MNNPMGINELKFTAMKRTIVLIIIGFLFLNFSDSSKETTKKITGDSISIFCTPDLNSLTTKWVDEFCSLNSDVKINVINVSDRSLANILNIRKDLGFVSDKYISALDNELVWKMVIARDIIVPVINSKNPLIKMINQQGVSSSEMAKIFIDPEKQNWGAILKSGQDFPVHYFRIDDESVNTHVANFLNLDEESIKGVKVKNGNELIASIQKDRFALGFCKLTDITDLNNKLVHDNIELLPIDKNANGKIDYVEKIYNSPNNFSRGVWIGKYDGTLFSNIYSVSVEKPSNETEKSFLEWILTNGQTILAANGYSGLINTETKSNVNTLHENSENLILVDDNLTSSASNSNKIIVVVSLCLVLILTIAGLIRYSMKKERYEKDEKFSPPTIFDQESLLIPKGLYYDKTYTWAFMKKNGMVRVGINDFLQHITGPLTRVKMKNNGDKIKKGEPIFSVIQNGKQLNIYSPISGIIRAQNEKLHTKSHLLNSSPYSGGWVYIIEPTNWLNEIRFLFMEKKYREWLKSEFSRLKDFFASIVEPGNTEYAYEVLQDGGEIKNGILTDYGPEVWEEFQINFIDTSK